ncbi:MAG TPA: TolC family protein [Gemmatimonas aurantiaca]|uniref:Outer membrane efflux protein n=2 Tax=Gemmatimonas aurantiaca TaxID=173480 RepID=C1A7I0_GEMAT|nr:TolC family protein [Gemmatimonas aurantiaca]BAH38190.1 outer membrane efflux protein [Gemmatimonas aurantiaca T-27]HCT56963.1 TolC family protein [Gemmatimonas aurantiaca]
MTISVKSHVLFRTVALAAGLLGPVVPSVAAAQAAPAAPAAGAILTLSDALALARRNNPTLQTSLNSRRIAAANVRAANGAFLPSVNTSLGGSYREGRQTFFQGQGFGSTNDQLSTDVSAGASLNLSMAALNDRRAVKANQDATESDIQAAEQRVRNDVTVQYMAALQQQARAQLQDTLLTTTSAQLQLAQARLQVGSGTQLDVQRAEVTHGQQRVAALNARNQAAIEIVRLYQQIGLPPVLETRLDTALAPTPTLDLQSVLASARSDNPTLDAARTRQESARRSIASARSGYIPTLALSANISGFTNRYTNTNALIQQGLAGVLSSQASCIRTEEVRARLNLDNRLTQCQGMAFTPADEQAIRDSQGKYPLDFTRNPYGLSATFSLPIFNGFRREQQIEQASVNQRNAQIEVRNQELRISSDVTAAYLQLNTAQQTVTMQEENVRSARTALELAQERYRVGAISIVDLVQARGDYERAATDRITAIYDVQRAFAALENAVGRPLR